MTICPWCGTNYAVFQPNCTNCGGPLLLGDQNPGSHASDENLSPPPAAPRPISDKYAWRLLFNDTGWIIALVFGILGFVFSLVGFVLTLLIITAFIGIPFLLLGIVALGVAVWQFIKRYQDAQKVVEVLRMGEATRGQVVDIQQNFSVRVNGQSPWEIRYQFQAGGQAYAGKVTTLNQPGAHLEAGQPVYVLYLAASPNWNSIYPHP